MKAHQYASLFPMMSDGEIQTLADDIREHGQQMPVITLDGEILDGRNRYRACEIAGMEPWLQAYQGDDPLSFVVASNLHRRHLTEAQRAMVASRLATLKVGAQQGNQNASKTNAPDGAFDFPKLPAQTRKEAAAALNVGKTSLDRARLIQRKGAPELVAAVDAGKVKLGTAETIISIPLEEQANLVATGTDNIKTTVAAMRASVVPEKPAKSRLPSYIPTDAPHIWTQAKITLDRIRPNDKHRERILNEIISYCETRLNTKQ